MRPSVYPFSAHTLFIVLLLGLLGLPARAQAPASLAETTGSVTFTASNLPILVIETTKGRSIPDEPKVEAVMGLIDNAQGQRNRLSDAYAFTSHIGIETRGASSQRYPKKSYALETRHADGSNRDVSLLGLAEDNDWILYAPYADKSLMRNVLAYHLARQMGRYAVRTRYVELVLNGDYRGVYVLMERIKPGPTRVPVADLRPGDISGDALTGGYIVQVDRWERGESWRSPHAPEGHPRRKIYYQYHEPDADDLTDAQRTYIRDYLTQFEDMMDGNAWDDPAEGYPAWIDVDSAIDFLLLNEIAKNIDGYRLSSYLYKTRDSAGGLLHLGPIWDFNFAFGMADYYDAADTAGFHVAFDQAKDPHHLPFWWKKLARHPAFTAQVADRWHMFRSRILADEAFTSFIDDQATLLSEAQRRNFRRWPTLGTYVWPNDFIGDTYTAEVNYLKTWLTARLHWLDLHIPQGAFVPD
ncbi:MAG: hypothetical protein RhofKO_23400 [Rhodothermales bacterium]